MDIVAQNLPRQAHFSQFVLVRAQQFLKGIEGVVISTGQSRRIVGKIVLQQVLAGLFLIQVRGDSMQPQISDGAWCLMRQPPEQPFIGRTLLIYLAETGGWLLKRVAAMEAPDSGGWLVRLTSRNSAYAPIELAVADPSDLIIAGELLEVVDGDAAG